MGLVQEMNSLHTSIKNWYSLPGDRLEAKVGDFVVDIVRGSLLIEVQTGNFSAIKKKLRSLVRNHNVQLVHPIPRRKWIVTVSVPNGETVRRRRSPKNGRVTDLFDELIRIPDLINEENFALEVLMIEEEEVRCQDGKGSWRRKGASVKDRKLIEVVGSATFAGKEDFLGLLPGDLHQPFSNRSVAENMGISVSQSRKMTYCLRKMGAIRKVGKNGNELLFETVAKT